MMNETVGADSEFMSRFLVMIIRWIRNPYDLYPMALNDTQMLWARNLDDALRAHSSEQELERIIHTLLMHCFAPYDDMASIGRFDCPLVRFIIAGCMTQTGQFHPVHTISNLLGKVQWCLRATIAVEVYNRKISYGGEMKSVPYGLI